MNIVTCQVTTLGRKFELDIRPITYTEEVITFEVVSVREIDKDQPGQRKLKGFEPPQMELPDEQDPLLELRT